MRPASLLQLLGGSVAQFPEDILYMSGSRPRAMQVAASGEEEGCAALPVQRLLGIDESPQGFPCTALRIFDGEDPVWALPFDICALLADRQNPGIVAHEIGAAAAIGADLPRGFRRVDRAEKYDQLMPREARWIDGGAGGAAELDIRNSEPESSRGHSYNIIQTESAITP